MTEECAGQGPVERMVRPGAEARWYCVSKDGRATLCTDKADAIAEVMRDTANWPLHAPYRAVQMVDAAEAAAEIDRLRADAARARGLIQRLATEARQSGDLVRDAEALALAAMYYGA